MKTTTQLKPLSHAIAIIWMVGSATQAGTLNEVVQQALSTNPEVQASMQQRNAREQDVKAAKADYYPEVYIAAGIGEENTDSPYTRSLSASGDSIDLTRQEVAFVIRQSLYSGFETSGNVDSARASLDAASNQFINTQERTSLRVSQVYLAVMRDFELLQVATINLQQHKDVYERVKQRSESGVGRRADFTQAEGRLAMAESHLIAAETNYQNSKVNYFRVVGSMPQNDMKMPPSFADALPGSLQEASDISQKENPSVKIAQANVNSASAQRTAVRSAYHPQFDLVYEQNWDENIDGVEGENDNYSIMLKMRYNLLNGGGDMARSNRAAFLVNESRAQQEQTQRLVSEDLNLAWSTYKALRSQLIYTKQHVDASVQTLDAYNKQYAINQRTLLDLLDAHNELFEANRAYISAQYDSQYQQYRILANLGRLTPKLVASTSGN